MRDEVWRWVLGLIYIVAVASIWIAASYVVQSVVDAGVSPFLITYICNSLFVIYLPLVEIGRYLEDSHGSIFFWRSKKDSRFQEIGDSEQVVLLEDSNLEARAGGSNQPVILEQGEISQHRLGVSELDLKVEKFETASLDQTILRNDGGGHLDSKGRWTRTRVAKASLLVCPFWFLAQLTFNLSLKYTTVTVSIAKFHMLSTFLIFPVYSWYRKTSFPFLCSQIPS